MKVVLLGITHIRNVVIPTNYDGGDAITLGMVEIALKELQDYLTSEELMKRLKDANPFPLD